MHAVARNVMYSNSEHSVNGWTVIRDRPSASSSTVDSEEIDRQSSYRHSYREHHSPYTLPPLTTAPSTTTATTTSSTRGSPVHLSLPIPPSLPFPSSKSPVSAPPHPHALPHDILHPYHPSSAHPSSAYSRERDAERDRDFDRYAAHHSSSSSAASMSLHQHHHAHHTKLPPLEVPPHPHSTHSPTSALASSTSKLTVNSLLSARPSPPPSHSHGLPPPQSYHHHSMAHHQGSHYPLSASAAPPPPTPKPTLYTSDATTKLSSYIRRRCYNCHTPDSAAWRRSSMHPGKVLCNKCGLYERTHQKDRPHDPAELRSKPRKTNHSSMPNNLLTTNPNPVHQQKLSGPGVVGVVDPVPPRPLNHGSLLAIHGSAPSSAAASPTIGSPSDRNGSGPHSLGALLNHSHSVDGSPGHSSMRLPSSSSSPAVKSSHLSPAGYAPSSHPNSPHLSSARDHQRDRNDRDSSYPSPRSNYSHSYSPREPYHGDIRSPMEERERERERERRDDRERRENEPVRDNSR